MTTTSTATLVSPEGALPFTPVAWLDICDGCGLEALLPFGSYLCNDCLDDTLLMNEPAVTSGPAGELR